MPRLQLAGLSLAQKLSLLLSIALFVVLGIAGIVISSWLGERMEQRSVAAMSQTNQQVVDTIDAYASVLENNARNSAAQLAANLPQPLRNDSSAPVSVSGVSTPALYGGEQLLNGNEAIVDRFSVATRGVATLFVREGDDFVRIASSLKKEDGTRAVATRLDHDHPAYPLLRSGQPYTGTANLFGRDYMTHYLPLKDGSGAVVGAMFAGIDYSDGLQALKQKILSLKIGDSGYVYVVDARQRPGELLIHPSAAGKNLLDKTDADGKPFIKTMLAQKNGQSSYLWLDPGASEPRRKLATFLTYERWGWLVATGAYQDELVREPHEMQLKMLLGTLLVTLLLVVLVYFSMRYWVSRPLAQLVDISRRVASGDLTVRIDSSRRDEIGEVLAASNHMCQALRQLISEVNQSVDSLAHNAQNLAALSDDVSGSSREQSAAVSAMAACVEEMTQSIQQVNQHAGSARELAVQSDEVSRSGEATVSRTVQTMREIAAASGSTAATVTQLGERSEQISRVVTVIRDIAEQTNLLALNAAIEAARAGEMGRGFAVVADEVRKLAERTTQSTLEISDTVGRIQSEAREAVDSMSSGVLQVEAGVKSAGEAGASLQSIRDGAKQVELAVAGISDALREQSTASFDIAHNVERVAQQADQNHQKAHDASLAACEMTAMAQQLRQSVARFHV
ncbi:methyl-accepting chemotaxis sensory transducer with Cache sensor [Vogesella indigofera]|uniref:Methyl-accepting chemotaxis sensory transducer with Cache sensor n=1 Tax=Vogesella indigofera TaxID=45465 RepID=A0A495BH33_VOGIN|nr:methyl-accepting chemotaxis protein [Vogesella indigofera]RKQ60279.1 methyl-accepting chemotaxis sensory transducer with Cache sensor [Vogesella indigofera]